MSNWSNPFVKQRTAAAWALMGCLGACQTELPQAEPDGPRQISGLPSAAPPSAAAPGAAAPEPAAAPDAALGGPAPVPEHAAQQYRRALDLIRSGRDADAESELKQLSASYPQYAGPQVNLGLLYVKESKLLEAESALEAAVQINPANVQAGNELGIVERKLGKFPAAEAAYQHTIAADPDYAPAHLNLGVLYDLYLAQPQKALDEFERYIELGGQNKQVAGWVVELRKRVGAAAAKKEPL